MARFLFVEMPQKRVQVTDTHTGAISPPCLLPHEVSGWCNRQAKQSPIVENDALKRDYPELAVWDKIPSIHFLYDTEFERLYVKQDLTPLERYAIDCEALRRCWIEPQEFVKRHGTPAKAV